MAETTFEEAKRCPKCAEPGQDQGKRPTSRPGTFVHTIECKNTLCTWFETTWLVQVNPDGSVPTPGSQGPKLYPVDKTADSIARQITESLQAQVEAETRRGDTAEVRNPYG